MIPTNKLNHISHKHYTIFLLLSSLITERVTGKTVGEKVSWS